MTPDIAPLGVPACADDAAWCAYVDIFNAAYAHDAGTDLLSWDRVDLLSRLQRQEHQEIHAYVARDDGVTIGAASLEFDRSTKNDVEFMVSVDPTHHGRGIDDALYEHLEHEARRLGRSVAIDFKATPVDGSGMDDADVIRPSSGIGGVPRSDENAKLLTARGYALGQVERASAYSRRSDPAVLRTLLADALAVAGSDYEPVWWSGRTPNAYVDAYAYAVSRMSTDIPAGDLTLEEQTWDAARIRAREDRVDTTGQTWNISAVVHRPTGTIVAFNELVVPADRTRPTENYGTLVLTEHRGRRLGTVVKCLGLIGWHETERESRCVFTFNAEENRHMLDVNERVGFVPRFWEGVWQKTLD